VKDPPAGTIEAAMKRQSEEEYSTKNWHGNAEHREDPAGIVNDRILIDAEIMPRGQRSLLRRT
jgi:hypothetical protein